MITLEVIYTRLKYPKTASSSLSHPTLTTTKHFVHITRRWETYNCQRIIKWKQSSAQNFANYTDLALISTRLCTKIGK